MDYNVVAIRSGDQEDDRLYPVLGAEDELIELDELDGPYTQFQVNGLSIDEYLTPQRKNVLTLTDKRVEVFITDARVAIACEKWEKGGGWVGFGGAGVAVALTANAVSKMRAARRRKGKLLVGHVRYSWLRCVGYKQHVSWVSGAKLRLGMVTVVNDDLRRALFLDLNLDKNADGAAIACDIVKRAARYRLQFTDIAPEDQDAYRQLAEAEPLPPKEPVTKKQGLLGIKVTESDFSLYNMPRFYPVSLSTAKPQQVA